jgi:hypothetical protein
MFLDMPGPDFSSVDSGAKAEDLLRRGQLEKLLLLPAEFGGEDIPHNVAYVPVGIAEVKAGIDANVIAPLIAGGEVTQYSAVPEYAGSSFVPIAIKIEAWEPGKFSTFIAIWGDALARPSTRKG